MSIGNFGTEQHYLQASSDGYTSPGFVPGLQGGRDIPINALGDIWNYNDGYSDAVSFNTVPVCIKSLKAWSVQISTDATGAGSFSIQISNDRSSQDQVPTTDIIHWTTIGFTNQNTGSIVTSETVAANSSVTALISQSSYRWFRIVWTSTATGHVTMSMQGGGS